MHSPSNFETGGSSLKDRFSAKKLLSHLTWKDGDVVFDKDGYLESLGEKDTDGSEPAEPKPEQIRSDFAGKSARERFLDIRPSSREDHGYLLKKIFDSPTKAVSMNDLSQQTGIKPQNIHARLKRLEGIGLLIRQKQEGKLNSLGRGTKEYVYCLASDISVEEIGELVSDFDSSDELDREEKEGKRSIEGDRTTEAQPMPQAQNQELDRIKSSISSKGLFEKLPGLPEFNPDWSEEQQNRWFALYEKIIDLGQGKK